MFLGEYLKDEEVLNLEKNLTKDNFIDSSIIAYEKLFDKTPHPSIFSGWKFFHTRKDLWKNFFNYSIPLDYPFTDVELQERGLHVFRMIFARHAGKLRAKGLKNFDDGVGIFKYENFLSDEIHARVSNEILTYTKSENINSSNNYNSLKSDSSIRDVIENSGIYELLCKAVRRDANDTKVKDFFLNTTFVQRLQNRANNGDIQKVCHSDVFYPCVKYWYFPSDVEEGCFTYAENSVKLTKEILDFHKEQSILVAKNIWNQKRNKGHAEGSFRAFDEDLEKMNLKLTPQKVKANTLVVANVSGFHCRGEVSRFSERNSIHGAIRMENCFDVK